MRGGERSTSNASGRARLVMVPACVVEYAPTDSGAAGLRLDCWLSADRLLDVRGSDRIERKVIPIANVMIDDGFASARPAPNA